MEDKTTHTMPDGTTLSLEHVPMADPAIVFLPGYMSDKSGTKAQHLKMHANVLVQEYLLIDYSGCGESEGAFADGTLSKWRDEVLAVIEAKVVSEKIILVGSSMGGWLMILVGLALGDRLGGMIGIAAAPDFSDWGYTEDQKTKLRAGETIYEDSPYGPDPTPTYARFWQDAETNKVLDSTIPISCPVRLIHGTDDTEVPPEISHRLARALAADDVTVALVEGGDHRLSREVDLGILTEPYYEFLQMHWGDS